MRTALILSAILIIATAVAACGQRVAPKPPADRVYDSMAY